MVSKVAVIALVAIVACPILLGYAMNLNEVTISEYVRDDDSVNVTPLLQNGTAYTTANGDLYQLNSQFERDLDDVKFYPNYESTTSVRSSMPLTYGRIENYNGGSFPNVLVNRDMYYVSFDYPYSATNYVTVQVYVDGVSVIATYSHVAYVLYERSINTVYITCKYSPNSLTTYTGTEENFTGFAFNLTGFATVPIQYGLINNPGGNNYADIAAGFHFEKEDYYGSLGWRIMVPEKTSTALMSINLNSISDSSYSCTIAGITFQKTTTAGVVSWTATRGTTTYDLYYDPSLSSNTYQMFIDYSDQSEPSDDPFYPDPYRKYTRSIELRYVGNWQQFMGVANSYHSYEFTYTEYKQPVNSYLNDIVVNCGSYARTPTMRVDAAEFQAFQYQVIENKTYDPNTFRDNPSTVVSGIQKYGTQIIFGGNTYTVKNGNITIGSHSIPVEGLIFSSAPNESGTYDNMIGKTIVSTSAAPSTIQFVGKWSASVSTVSMSETNYTKTEWTAGEFGWDGLDQNFLIVGLLTSVGVFIALGIYIRRTKAALWPLLLVCGGAAMLFFCML